MLRLVPVVYLPRLGDLSCLTHVQESESSLLNVTQLLTYTPFVEQPNPTDKTHRQVVECSHHTSP